MQSNDDFAFASNAQLRIDCLHADYISKRIERIEHKGIK